LKRFIVEIAAFTIFGALLSVRCGIFQLARLGTFKALSLYHMWRLKWHRDDRLELSLHARIELINVEMSDGLLVGIEALCN